ncbi:hypothetical protein NQ314_012236 [Rhamnusium bicolor]|uniref:Uncharacterized protein n=1 Tax=Rhamnusium bicolor TaxID=1586634 RepID=A0AAV8XCI5_9CUCU|nr:hypothetical protein NQ314_012236 [Rhamnusium bicolor]
MFPYLVLTIFFFRGITLEGASSGLAHMLTPKVDKLWDPKVWLDAATQVFYSFGLAFGSLIAFGSYNTPKNNCVRDVILVSVCNAITAIYASVVIFAILGYKAVSNVNKCVKDNKGWLMAHDYLANVSKGEVTSIVDTKYLNALTAANHSNALRVCSLDRELDDGDVVETPYPNWVLAIAITMILAGILPIPIVFLLRRYQLLKMDINIHEGSIRRIDTTVSTKEMITDVDFIANEFQNPSLRRTDIRIVFDGYEPTAYKSCVQAERGKETRRVELIKTILRNWSNFLKENKSKKELFNLLAIQIAVLPYQEDILLT